MELEIGFSQGSPVVRITLQVYNAHRRTHWMQKPHLSHLSSWRMSEVLADWVARVENSLTELKGCAIPILADSF
jgi:hypothetical protein